MTTQMNTALADRANELRLLHAGPPPLVLPNAWDVASARLVANAGFPVVATSSSAVAASLGYEDTPIRCRLMRRSASWPGSPGACRCR